MRVVLTGCSVREPERDGPAAALPGGRPVPAARTRSRSWSTGSGWRRRRARSVRCGPIGAVGATTTVGRAVVGVADDLRRPVPGRSGRGPSRAARRSAPGCRSSTAATRRAPTASSRSAAARSAAARSTTSSTRRGPWPPPAIARSRCSARTSIPTATTCAPEPRFAHVDAERWAGRRLDLHGRPGPRRADPGDRWAADGRRPTGDPSTAVRDVASVGPVGSTDRGAGRVPERLRAPPPARPVRRRRRAATDGPPVHDRALPRTARPHPRGRARHHDLDRRDRRVLRRDRGAVRVHAAPARGQSATTRCSRRPTRPGRGRRPRASPTTSRRT